VCGGGGTGRDAVLGILRRCSGKRGGGREGEEGTRRSGVRCGKALVRVEVVPV